MAKSARSRRRWISAHQFRSAPYTGDESNLKRALTSERKDWDDATCPVCLEFPHSAVLLLCSSHENGCRPFMCGTNYRHSNCLDRFNKAHTKVRYTDPAGLPNSSEAFELACPLCRGLVKGWTVVESARKCLNNKKRSCVKAGCSFIGTYKELKKHVKCEHPGAKAREIDPEVEEKWRALERESERQDVISTIMSRSVVFGDYVIEMEDGDVGGEEDEEEEDDDEGRSGISRSILYFLREGARLMDGINGVADMSSAVGTGGRRGRDVGVSRAERRQGRRQRRSRGPSPFDVS